jgi:hypothetical protein
MKPHLMEDFDQLMLRKRTIIETDLAPAVDRAGKASRPTELDATRPADPGAAGESNSRLARSTGRGETGYSCGLAQERFPVVLAKEFTGENRQTADITRDHCPDRGNGDQQPHVASRTGQGGVVEVGDRDRQRYSQEVHESSTQGFTTTESGSNVGDVPQETCMGDVGL